MSKKDLREKLATAYKISDVNCVHVFGMKTAFGGGRSTGFALMYDNLVQAYVEQLRLAKLANLQNFAKQASTTAVSRGGAKLVFMEGCI